MHDLKNAEEELAEKEKELAIVRERYEAALNEQQVS